MKTFKVFQNEQIYSVMWYMWQERRGEEGDQLEGSDGMEKGMGMHDD